VNRRDQYAMSGKKSEANRCKGKRRASWFDGRPACAGLLTMRR